jgi:hypothetical protein
MGEGWLVRVVISSRKIAKCYGLLCCTYSWLLGSLQKDLAVYGTLSLVENEQRVLGHSPSPFYVQMFNYDRRTLLLTWSTVTAL